MGRQVGREEVNPSNRARVEGGKEGSQGVPQLVMLSAYDCELLIPLASREPSSPKMLQRP